MPAVQFVRQDRGVRITRSMPTPKRIHDINAWLREAKKVIRDLASFLDAGGFVHTYDTDIKWVKFDLRNGLDEKAQVVIDRTAKFGG